MTNNPLVLILFLLSILDVISGLLTAGIKGEVSSPASFQGMLKKAFMFLIVGMAAALNPFVNGVPVLGGTAGYFCVTEAISIIENAGKAGIPIPPILTKAVKQLNFLVPGKDDQPKTPLVTTTVKVEATTTVPGEPLSDALKREAEDK